MVGRQRRLKRPRFKYLQMMPWTVHLVQNISNFTIVQTFQDKKVNSALQRLETLQQRSMDVRDSLEDSLVYHEFVKDIHDALLWEKEKYALVSSGDFGKSLVEVQSMMKRHQLLEVDIANHDSIVKALAGKGDQVGHWKT